MKDRGLDVGILLLGLGVAAALMWRGSALPRPWLGALDQSAYWILLAAALLAAFAGAGSPARERPRRWAWGLAATFVLFSLPPAYLWSSGRTTYPALGGFLPWSDAADYHFGALHLLNDGVLNEFNLRRPLNAAFLAVRLGALGRDLAAALAVQAWVTAAAAFLAAAAVARSHGLGAGLLSLGLLYEFARPYVGTTFSECLGLAFGCLGFAACWAAAGHAGGRRAALCGGAALLALGLCARSGAYAVLPVLVVWAALAFPPRPAWRLAAWTAAGTALGLLVNASLYRQFGTERGVANSNLAEIVYGIAAGGQGWDQVLRDHPECLVGSERERARCFYALALERLRASPGTALRGYAAGVRSYTAGMFSFASDVSSPLWRPESRRDQHTEPLLLALAAAGAVAALRSRRDPRMSLLLAAGLAALAFTPLPKMVQGRVFATTIPFTVALAAVGLAALGRWASRIPGGAAADARSTTPSAGRPARGPLTLGAVLALACSAGPAAAIALHVRPRFGPPRCPIGHSPVIFAWDREAAYLQILPDAPGTRTQVPQVSYADWRFDTNFAFNDTDRIWRKLRPGDRVIRGYDYTPGRLVSERHFWMIVPGDLEMPRARYLLACTTLHPRAETVLFWGKPAEIQAIEPWTGP